MGVNVYVRVGVCLNGEYVYVHIYIYMVFPSHSLSNTHIVHSDVYDLYPPTTTFDFEMTSHHTGQCQESLYITQEVR